MVGVLSKNIYIHNNNNKGYITYKDKLFDLEI